MKSYDVKLIEQPTGATHNVVGSGIVPILDEATGEPETQYVLVAEVEGHYVNLGTFTKGYVEHLAGLEHTAINPKSKSTTSASSSKSSSSSG